VVLPLTVRAIVFWYLDTGSQHQAMTLLRGLSKREIMRKLIL
jgi:hypothetical protein